MVRSQAQAAEAPTARHSQVGALAAEHRKEGGRRRTNTTGVGRGGSSSCQVCQSAPTHKRQCLHCLRSERNKQNLEAATIREGQAAASEEWAGAGRRDCGFSPQAFRAVSLTSITYNVFSTGLAKTFTQVFHTITEKLKQTFWPT